MPPKGKQQAAKGRARSRPAVAQNTSTSKAEMRSRSRDSANLDESMKSAQSASKETDGGTVTPASLQAQHELEIQQVFAQITEQIIQGGQESTAVTVVMKRTLVLQMRKSPALFQKTLIGFIERLITFEGDESHLKNFHLLITRFFVECVQERDRSNGVKLTKSVIRYLLDVYHLPKLLQKVQHKCGHMLALVINATAAKPKANSADAEEPSNSQMPPNSQPLQQTTQVKQGRVFGLLDDNHHDKELRRQLEETVVQMLTLTKGGSFASQNQGIQIASLISNFKDDRMYLQLLKLLSQSRSADIRKRVIKSIRAPYSASTLAFLGKRLRDENGGVAELVFDQFISNGVTISQFPTPEARMLVLTEGFTAAQESVREKCLDFFKPTVLEYAEKNDIAGLLKLTEARLAFGNQYFGRMPGLITLGILEILEQDVTLVDYLEQVVFKKIRKQAGISLTRKKKSAKETKSKGKVKEELDEFDLALLEQSEKPERPQDAEMLEASEQQPEVADAEMESLGDVTFEEILLLRLVYEINRSTKSQRSQAYLDKLEELVPEYEEYRQITFALAKMDEPDLPLIDAKDETIKPYPKGQVGFTRRAILGEWMKFSLQLNISDEIIRKNLTTLCFELISKIEYSFADYEHLLKKRTQLLQGDTGDSGNNGAISALIQACSNDDEDVASDIEEVLGEQLDSKKLRQSALDFQQEEEPQQVEIEIRTFANIGIVRSLQEYCRPYQMETLTLDFDDVCQIAVTVAKTLLGDRVDEFQLKIMEAISDIKETIQEEEIPGNRNASAATMMFSQLPQTQQPDSSAPVSFAKLRNKFMKKIEQKVDTCKDMGFNPQGFDITSFNKIFKQVQIFVQLVEETHLKEKLSYKRALILCRSLLKQCRLANVNESNVISICETLIHPTILNMDDKENILLSLECIGLICILDKEVFVNYSKIFTQILEQETQGGDKDNKREKVIAIKSVVDALIIHGLAKDEFKYFYSILTTDYLGTKEPILRQITIECVCKMLFTTKLCDQHDPAEVENILARLLFQMFDPKHSMQNSLVKSVLKQFICNFVLFSEQRCQLMINAITKVSYAVLRERYGLEKRFADFKPAAAAKKAKKGPAAKAQKKGGVRKRALYSDDSDSEDEFAISMGAYESDDSLLAEKKVQMREVCNSVDFIQLCKVIMVLLSRKYVNENNGEGTFKLKQELSLVFFKRLLNMNDNLFFKKTQIVKDIMTQIVEAVSLDGCDSLTQLRQIEQQWDKNAKLLLQATGKIAKFNERLSMRIHELEEIEEANEQCASDSKDQDVEMKNSASKSDLQKNHDMDDGKDDLGFDMDDLETYWNREIEDRVIDRSKDNDREILQMQQVWIDLTSRDGAIPLTSSAKKSILKSPSNFGMRMGQFGESTPVSSAKKQAPTVRPRRGGRRQAAARGVTDSAVKVGGKLQPITEEIRGGGGTALSARGRKVRIIEEKKEPQRRNNNFGPGATRTKSEVSEEVEYDSESDCDSLDDDDDSRLDSSLTNPIGEDSNLSRIAKGVARNFAAKNSKRLSGGGGADVRLSGENDRWQQARGISKIKLEQPTTTAVMANLQVKTELLSDSKAQRVVGNIASDDVKKELIRDFQLAEDEQKAPRRGRRPSSSSQKRRGKMQTRRGRKQSDLSRSLSSNAAADVSIDDDDSGDDLYDFMDGTATKQLKRQKQQAQLAATHQKELAGGRPATAAAESADVSKSSIKSKSSVMRTRQRRVKPQ